VLTDVLPKNISSEGSTQISIFGRNFKPSLAEVSAQSTASDVTAEGACTLRLGSDCLLGIKFQSTTQLTAVTAAQAPGPANLTLVTQEGTTSSLPAALTYKVVPKVTTSPAGSQTIRQRIPFIVDSKAFRTNFGVNNLEDSPATVDVSLVNANGESDAKLTVIVPPKGMTQINHIVRRLEGVSEADLTGREGYLIVESPHRVEAWASQVDNLTADPSLQQSKREALASARVLLPSSASLSQYRTSLIVINNTDKAGQVQIRPRTIDGQLQKFLNPIPIKPNGYLFYEDFYQSIGIGGAFGPVEIEALGEIKITATARIYTLAGTSGYFEAVDVELASRSVILPYVVDTVNFRTNLGITNPGNAVASAQVTLFTADGLSQGTLQVNVPAHGMAQINGITHQFGTGAGTEGYLRLVSDQPVLGWTAQIDNLSTDLSFVVGKAASTATRLLVPSTTSTDKFKSTLTVVNLAAAATTIRLNARDNEGTAMGSRQVVIPANGFIVYDDVLSSMGLSGNFGPLEIVSSDDRPIHAVSRVYSPQRTGGYFEGVARTP
jgi:IPT/TIG domain